MENTVVDIVLLRGSVSVNLEHTIIEIVLLGGSVSVSLEHTVVPGGCCNHYLKSASVKEGHGRLF